MYVCMYVSFLQTFGVPSTFKGLLLLLRQLLTPSRRLYFAGNGQWTLRKYSNSKFTCLVGHQLVHSVSLEPFGVTIRVVPIIVEQF